MTTAAKYRLTWKAVFEVWVSGVSDIRTIYWWTAVYTVVGQ